VTVRPSHGHSATSRGISPVEITASKPISSRADQVFGLLMSESVIEVFDGVLGKIAGQALLDAVRRDASTETKDFLEKPESLDHALVAHLGRAAKVLERRILKTLASKTVAGTPPIDTGHFNFALEVEKVKREFLKRKQAAKGPQTLE